MRNWMCRKGTFTLTARYTDDSPIPEGFDRTIGTYEVRPLSHPLLFCLLCHTPPCAQTPILAGICAARVWPGLSWCQQIVLEARWASCLCFNS